MKTLFFILIPFLLIGQWNISYYESDQKPYRKCTSCQIERDIFKGYLFEKNGRKVFLHHPVKVNSQSARINFEDSMNNKFSIGIYQLNDYNSIPKLFDTLNTWNNRFIENPSLIVGEVLRGPNQTIEGIDTTQDALVTREFLYEDIAISLENKFVGFLGEDSLFVEGVLFDTLFPYQGLESFLTEISTENKYTVEVSYGIEIFRNGGWSRLYDGDGSFTLSADVTQNFRLTYFPSGTTTAIRRGRFFHWYIKENE